jgi:hypothetical protein
LHPGKEALPNGLEKIPANLMITTSIHTPPAKRATTTFCVAHYFGWLVFCAACSPAPTPEPSAVVQTLQNLSELATTQFTVCKVITANDNLDWYKFGERKLLITCQATIKAGIDLGALEPKDVVVSGKSIRMTLPPPKILAVNIQPEHVKVVWQQIGWLRGPFTASETDALMSQAEQQMWAAGEALRMPEQAKLHTQSVVSNLLTQLGFTSVTLSFEAPKPLG